MTNEETTTSEQEESLPLQVDDKCDILWRNGEQKLPAVVVERRPMGHRKRKKNERAPDLSTLKADEIEYYVHYSDHDRYVGYLFMDSSIFVDDTRNLVLFHSHVWFFIAITQSQSS
jgi:hypothetical protein